MICLNAAGRAVGHVTFDRQHDTRPVNSFRNLRSGNSYNSSMPPFAGDNRHMSIGFSAGALSQFGDCQINDLLLHFLSFLIASVEMLRKPSGLLPVSCIEELNHGSCCVHSACRVYPGAQPKTEIVCCHALAISATGNLDQGS